MKNKMPTSRYDRNPGKDAAMANVRGKRLESMHKDANAFVKAEQAKVKSKAGHEPRLSSEYLHFNGQMMNSGEHAQEFGRELTKGLDKDAFPVK